VEGKPKQEGRTPGRADCLRDLVDCLLSGRACADHPQAANAESARHFLAWLAYSTLVDGVEEFDRKYVYEKPRMGLSRQATDAGFLEKIAARCGLLQKVTDSTFRFGHPVLQEYLAATAMYGATLDLNLEKMAAHANQIREKEQIARWSRALALRLDSGTTEDDASRILGALLNYGLPPGYGTQLRNNAGPLSPCVCRAVLHTENLQGEKLRKALGWCEFVRDWTGYRPDEWRAIEELLRYLEGVASRVRDDAELASLFARFLRNARVIEIALIRFALARELRKRAQKEPTENLARLYEREYFFELAGHSCSDCPKTQIANNLRVIPEGWFLMGALDAEERSWPNERPQHRVLLGTYRIALTETTNAQYEVFDPDHREFRFAEDHPKDKMDNWQCYPVVRVSWYEAWCFAEWMGMRLPTEAQWEKAARGKNFDERPAELSPFPTPYWFGNSEDDLRNAAWFRDNSNRHACSVNLPPNESASYSHGFDLGGLCGNVWEWCMDEQGFEYTETDREYPAAFEENVERNVITNRVIRGGSYDSPAWDCRHAVRQFTFPTVRANTIGFRLCHEPLDKLSGEERFFEGHCDSVELPFTTIQKCP
jgi:formylglycine-generating enzyme required for sulfatase activity